MLDDPASVSTSDSFIARKKWLTTNATVCLVEDTQGRLLCHARVVLLLTR